jgi:hypothetical protein
MAALVLIGGGAAAATVPQTPALDDMKSVAFMAGCWRGTAPGGSTIEEFYTAASRNLMLGTTRYLRGDSAVSFEFARIERSGGRIVLTPYPSGRMSEHGFVLTSARPNEVVFEAPEHDYPKRILYRVNPDGTHTARIDAGVSDPKPVEYPMAAATCAR